MIVFTWIGVIVAAVWAAILACLLVAWAAGALRKRREDRAYAADVARRVREREAGEVHDSGYLAWLEDQFASGKSKGRRL